MAKWKADILVQTSLNSSKWFDGFFPDAKQRDLIGRDLKQKSEKFRRRLRGSTPKIRVPTRLHRATVLLQRKHENRGEIFITQRPKRKRPRV